MKKVISIALLIVILSCLIISCNNNDGYDYTPMGTNTSTSSNQEPTIAPGHTYTDDGDCKTALICDECGEVLIEANTTHKYTTVQEYSFVNDDINMGGVRTVSCSNYGCSCVTKQPFEPFVKALGYSVAEFESSKSATITASYIFNAQDLIDYSDYLSQVNNKRIKFEYGILIYIEGQVSGAPITKAGAEAYGVVKAELTRVNGINDFSVPKIGKNAYDSGIYICAYLILNNELYYIQSNNVYTEGEYKSLKPVTVNMLLGNE